MTTFERGEVGLDRAGPRGAFEGGDCFCRTAAGTGRTPLVACEGTIGGAIV
jgi:hypothetical protein